VLAGHFWTQFANDPQAAPPAELLIDWLRRDWPGNVRELRSAVERAVLLDDPTIWAEISTTVAVAEPAAAAPVDFDDAASFRVAKERAVAAWERGYVRELVRRHGSNLSRAARAAHGSQPPARAAAPPRRVDHRRVAPPRRATVIA
jgi:DNA-binding NtrC family response regulator